MASPAAFITLFLSFSHFAARHTHMTHSFLKYEKSLGLRAAIPPIPNPSASNYCRRERVIFHHALCSEKSLSTSIQKRIRVFLPTPAAANVSDAPIPLQTTRFFPVKTSFCFIPLHRGEKKSFYETLETRRLHSNNGTNFEFNNCEISEKF
jgi:hypothetical protein